jgi:hypothetical protein
VIKDEVNRSGPAMHVLHYTQATAVCNRNGTRDQ